MSGISKKVLIFMVALAVIFVSFGIGSRYDFFASMSDLVEPVNKLTAIASRIVQSTIGETVFLYDDNIEVHRMYFDHDLAGWRGTVDDDGNRVEYYIDVGKLDTFISKANFLTSSDPRVSTMEIKFDVSNLGLQYKFYDSNGTLLYEWSMWSGYYYINVTYKEYLYNYRDVFSSEKWKYFTGV